MDTENNNDMLEKYESKLLIRFIQDFRKESKLVPSDKIKLYYNIKYNNYSSFNNIKILVEESIKNMLLDYKDNDNDNSYNIKKYNLKNGH